MKIDSLSEAVALAKRSGELLWVEIKGEIGIFEIYSGGRVVKYPDVPRFRQRLSFTKPRREK